MSIMYFLYIIDICVFERNSYELNNNGERMNYMRTNNEYIHIADR